jgi:pilus assembly protein Flp/PilA
MGVRSPQQLARCEEAITAIEYALIAGLVAIAIVAGATIIGETLGSVFDALAAGF